MKVKLIKEITESDNEELLKDVSRFIELECDDQTPYTLSLEQLSIVAEARAEVSAGKFITDEESNRQIDEWLEK